MAQFAHNGHGLRSEPDLAQALAAAYHANRDQIEAEIAADEAEGDRI